jgi:curved DNA-binding protein
MEFKDYYKIMGVAENADTDAIRKAYRKLARKYHPDVSKEADAEQHFKEVGEAYEVLKDKDKRTEYDQLRKLGARGRDGSFRPPPGWQARNGGQQTSADGDFSDFFSSIFGGFGGAQQAGHSTARQAFRRRGEDVHSTLALLLDEAHQGGDKQISFQVQDSDEQGHLRRRRKTLKVKIPAGVTRGQQIRLKGQGGPGMGGAENGDLFIEIDLAPHPLFVVDGKHLQLTVPITATEAALGASIKIPSLGGPLNIKIPADSSGGQKLRLAGKGLSKAGDLIVILRISMPKQHSDQARELYRQLATETQYNPRTDWGNLA